MKHVYILRGGEKHYKVGVAVNVASRISSIKTSNPNKVELVASRFLEDAENVEQELHIKLAEYRTKALNEWFELSPPQVVQLCVLLASYKQPKFLGAQVTTETLLARLDLEHDEINAHLRAIQGQIETLASRVKSIEVDAGHPAMDYAIRDSQTPSNPTVEETLGPAAKREGDVLEELALQVCIDAGKASSSLLQTRLSIGYARAARLIDALETKGLVGPHQGASPREVYGRLQNETVADVGGAPVGVGLTR